MSTPAPDAIPEGRYRLTLAKGDFKFSVAHFTVFSENEAELLHGHNYRVSVELSGGRLGELGLLADVARVKTAIRALCAELDSHTLLPTESPLVAVGRTDDGDLEVRYGDRRYRLPAADVKLLPLVNTTMEQFARYLWRRLRPSVEESGVDRMAVTVEETDGQSCTFTASLQPRTAALD